MLYCPKCGEKSLSGKDAKQYVCNACEFVFFQNTAAAVIGAVVVDDDLMGKQLLVAIRAHEPGKGLWDLPGGFVDPDESAESALQRELQEEIGVTPTSFEYVISFPNIYPYKDVVYKTCDLVYRVHLPNNAKIQAADDVASLIWVSLADIDVEQFAFESTKRAVQALQD